MREVNIRLRKLEMELSLSENFPQDLLLKHFNFFPFNKKILLKQLLFPIQIFEGKRYSEKISEVDDTMHRVNGVIITSSTSTGEGHQEPSWQHF